MIINNVVLLRIEQRKPSRTIYLAGDLWGIVVDNASKELTLKVGVKTVKVNVARLLPLELQSTIGLSAKLYRTFGFIGIEKLNLKIDWTKGLIELGPVVGVMTTLRRQGGKYTSLYERLARVARDEGVMLYFFGPRDVRPKRKLIKGYRYTGTWSSRYHPVPDVVYDQVRSRRAERNPYLIRTKSYLIGDCRTYFNRAFLNKWQVHQWLNASQEVKRFLPRTLEYTQFNFVIELLKEHGVVYLKPDNGSLGQGIVRVQTTDYGFLCEWVHRQRTVKKQCVTSKELEIFLRLVVRRKPYIVQQGIELLKIKGCPMDLRILMQKDHRGEWQETYRFAKVGSREGVATNVAAGGMVYEVDTALREGIGADLLKLYKVELNIQKLLKAVCTVLDEQKEGLAEIGMDVGIDINGQVWLIEVNSKYSRYVFPLDIQNLSIVRPLAYAKWLVGWHPNGTQGEEDS